MLVGYRTYYNGWCCGDMLIGSLQASAEQQSLTIRKNNDFTMKEPTLSTSGKISMHCRSLGGSCRPLRAPQLEMPPVPLKLCGHASLLADSAAKERSEGIVRDGLVGW